MTRKQQSSSGSGNSLDRIRPLPGTPSRHDRVAAVLREMIQSELKPGDPLPSVRDLMKALGVSMPTVRAGQAILASEGLLEVRQGRGVFVAEHASRWRIGILSELDLLHPRTGHYFRALASEVTTRLIEAGLTPELYNGKYLGMDPQDEPTCPRFWIDVEAERLDGAVIVDLPHTTAWEKRLEESPIPLVGSYTDLTTCTDSESIVSLAARRLAEQGCRRVALITWELNRVLDPFLRTVSDTGMMTSEAWIRGNLDPAVPGGGWDEFREVWTATDEKPDGLIVLDDMLFQDAQLAIFELGIQVPEDLRIAVQTNRGSEVTVRMPVTAIEVDPAEAAQFLADSLIKRLRGELLPPTTCTLSFRELAAAEGPPGKTPETDADRLQATRVDSRRFASAVTDGKTEEFR